MPCSACGGGSFCACGGAFEAPLLLGGGDDATGSLAGWLGAGLRFFVIGARASEGSLTAAAGALFFSGFFVLFFAFRVFPCASAAATRGTAGAAATARGDCCDGSAPSGPENRPAPPKPWITTERAPPRITTTGIRTAIARRCASASRFQIRVRDDGAPAPDSTLSAAASRVNVSVLGGCPSSMRATLAWLVSILAARSSCLSPSPARRTATSRPKTSPPLLLDLLPASTDLRSGGDARAGLNSGRQRSLEKLNQLWGRG
jgi:hypothetical protein